MNGIHQILQTYWGHQSFRPLQEEIITSVMQGKDTLALLPTGGGKSICFQVPAMAMDGICVVISPLIALMKDQVENLSRRGIPAKAICAGMNSREILLILNAAVHGRLKFLYVSPERLASDVFIEHLKQMKICLLAVDEAHCISQWGYDFRPPYLKIADIRPFFPGVPVIALTATATPEVVEDIQKRLLFQRKNVFQQSFMRKNLTYYVFKEEDKLDRMLRIIRTVKGSGVVYVRNRKRTKDVAEYLNRHHIKASHYHAGLDGAVRTSTQAEWISGVTPVIVATNAFGMGIDKPNVRFVIHLDLPDSLEAYFQEAGRGGRDGLRAFAVLLFEKNDRLTLEKNMQITFPPLDFILAVYQALGNYFKLPLGAGKDASFDFDLKTFSANFQWNHMEVYHALHFLEKEGLILLSDDVNTPAKAMIITDKNSLYSFQVKYPDYDQLIKLMLRSYGGLFSHMVNIYEKDLAKYLDWPVSRVEEMLYQLSKWKLIDYEPLKSKPQLIFTEKRLDIKSVSISKTHYQDRKRMAQKRLDAVFHYVESDHVCHSRLLLSYFGENNSPACGHCDVCIALKKNRLSPSLFDEISGKVKQLLETQSLSIDELIHAMPGYNPEKIIETVRQLLDEEALQQDGQGKIHTY